MQKKGKTFYIMTVIVLCGLGAVIYSVLTYGQTFLHSDTEASLRYYNSMVSSGKLFPNTWIYSNGELYTSSLIFNIAFIMHFLIKNAIIARIFASFIAIIFSCLCIIWFSDNIFKNGSWVIMIPLIFIFLRSANTKEMLLYQTAYIDYLWVFSLAIGIALKIIYSLNEKKVYKILNFIIIFLLMASGIRYAAEYVAPLIGSILLCDFIEEKRLNKESLLVYAKKSLYLFVAPSLLGYVLYFYICSTHDMDIGTRYNETEIIASKSAFIENLKLALENLFSIFGYTSDSGFLNNIVSILLAVAIFFIGPLLEIIKFRKFSKAKKTFVSFGIIHNILLLAIIIVMSKTLERYLLSCVYIAIMLTADYCYETFVISQEKTKYFFLGIFVVLVTVFSANLIGMSQINGGWREVLESQKKVGDILAEKGITKGYASYWNAYTYEYYSNQQITFGAVFLSERVLEKNFGLVDLKAFEHKEGRSCILFTKDEDEQFNNAVHILLGPESETFTIKDTFVYDNYNNIYYKTDLVIYVYDEDVGDKLTDGIADGFCHVNEMQFNWIGTMDENTIYMENGGFVHGPYSLISEGHYNVKIEGENLVGCDCGIVSEISPEYINSNVLTITGEYIEIDLTVSKKVKDIQFCLLNPKDETVEFHDVVITKL